MSSHLGSGLSLDRNWDLFVDESTGDLSFDQAEDEVRKDLAFTIGRALRNEVGEYMSREKLSDIEIYTRKLILSDERVDSIEKLRASFDNTDGTVNIEVELTTVDGTTIQDVFTAGN